MTRRTVAIIGAVAAAVVGVVGALGVPALAGTDDPTMHWMRCTGGQPVRHGRLDVVIPAASGFVNVGGTITPCHQPAQDEYAIDVYSGKRSAHGFAFLRGYRTDGRVHTSVQVLPGTVAVCLSSRETGDARSSVRLGCFEVRYTKSDEKHNRLPVVGRRLAVDDPLVRRAADPAFETIPTCPACWT